MIRQQIFPFFINRDPIGEAGGVNLYGFVGNDPVNRWDYLGLDSGPTEEDDPKELEPFIVVGGAGSGPPRSGSVALGGGGAFRNIGNSLSGNSQGKLNEDGIETLQEFAIEERISEDLLRAAGFRGWPTWDPYPNDIWDGVPVLWWSKLLSLNDYNFQVMKRLLDRGGSNYQLPSQLLNGFRVFGKELNPFNIDGSFARQAQSVSDSMGGGIGWAWGSVTGNSDLVFASQQQMLGAYDNSAFGQTNDPTYWTYYGTRGAYGVAVTGTAIATGTMAWQAVGGGTMSVTVGSGQPVHVAWQAGNNAALHAHGLIGNQVVTTYGAQSWMASSSWFTITGIPVANTAATYTYGSSATTCVGACAHAFARGWWWPW